MRNPTRTLAVAAAVLATAAVLVGCGPAGPPRRGRPPSAVVLPRRRHPRPTRPATSPTTRRSCRYTPPTGLFTVSVPEGWARSTDGAATIFTDKFNTVRIETRPLATAPNTESVSVDELPPIASSTPGYRPGTVTAVHTQGRSGHADHLPGRRHRRTR